MDKLDLLGVRFDYEMELKMKHDIAEKVVNTVHELGFQYNHDGNNDDFYDICTDEICNKLGYEKYQYPIQKEVEEILDIIEENYIKRSDFNGL